MKSTIAGKIYDTETAAKMCCVRNGAPGDQFYCKAALYQTPRSGHYFLAGRGGAMTRFARATKSGMRGGIIRLTEAEAEAFISAFGAR